MALVSRDSQKNQIPPGKPLYMSRCFLRMDSSENSSRQLGSGCFIYFYRLIPQYNRDTGEIQKEVPIGLQSAVSQGIVGDFWMMVSQTQLTGVRGSKACACAGRYCWDAGALTVAWGYQIVGAGYYIWQNEREKTSTSLKTRTNN